MILSQYDDPEYAISLLSRGRRRLRLPAEGPPGRGRPAGIDAIRAVATGGTLLDPAIVDALVRPVQTGDDDLSDADQELLTLVAEGKPIKAIAVAQHTTPAAVSDAVEHLFLELAKGASTGADSALRRLRMLHQAIVDREEQGETLSRLLPGGLAEKLRREGRHIGETEELVVTVLMSDIRGYSTIAERPDPARRASSTSTGPR